MDVCHLLLGRPWQYDRKVIYDGFKNTYTFRKDRHKIVLTPLKPAIAPATKPAEQNSLLSKSELEKEIRAGSDVMALVAIEETESEKEIPKEVEPILAEFVDVVPEEIPHGLPHMRDIQHQIDLVLGSVLPNKPAYRMSPKEHEELTRQVDEFLNKGLIRESKSPCAVPTRCGKIGPARWASPIHPELGPGWAIKLLARKKLGQVWPGPIWPGPVWPDSACLNFFCLQKAIWLDQPGF